MPRPLFLAAMVLFVALVAVVGCGRVSMQTPGAEPDHYAFPANAPLDSLNSPRLTSASTVAHDLAFTSNTLAVADTARGLSLYPRTRRYRRSREAQTSR